MGGWANLETLTAVADRIATQEMESRIKLAGANPGASLGEFISAWETAQNGSRARGGVNDYKQKPRVFIGSWPCS